MISECLSMDAANLGSCHAVFEFHEFVHGGGGTIHKRGRVRHGHFYLTHVSEQKYFLVVSRNKMYCSA